MKSVSDVLKRDNNNFDLLRIFCAIMVIFAHSYYLSNANGAPEPLQSLLPFTYTGSVAVKIFFFISGLLVTNSLISNKSTIHFLVSRFFRIYPAFIFVILFTAIVVGPIVTSLDIASYFSNPLTVDYIKNSSVFDMAFMLPGVFDANIYKGSVNGSLWTIPYEVASYAVLLGCFLLTENKNKYISSLICLIVIISPITGWNRFLFINSDNADVYLMAPCFALGALFAIHKEKKLVSLHIPAGIAILYFFISSEIIKHLLFYFFICTSTLYLSSLKTIRRIKVKHDISYGVYLWGYMIEQIVYYYLPSLSLHFNQALCIILSVIFGYLSFILIEKPSMRIGKIISSKIS